MNQQPYRIAELDGLRGIAALAVLLYHFTTRFGEKFDTSLTTNVWEFTRGHYGVSLFFIISGFVILMTIERTGSPRTFIFKRFVRLYPTFWLCVTLTFLFCNAFGPEIYKRTISEFAINLTMIPSVFNTRYIDGVYWSLLIELVFYAFMLFLLITQLIPKIKYVGFLYILFYALVVLYHKYYPELFYGGLFLAGINFYKIWKDKGSWINHLQLFLLLIIIFFSNLLETWIAIAIFYSLFYLVAYRLASFLRLYPIVFIGEISYALYLIHQHIGHSLQLLLIQKGVTNYYLLLLWPMLTCIIIAWLITIAFEKPVIAYLNNWYKNRK